MGFLRRRPTLFQPLEDGRVAAARHAADFLQYKRALMQYLADSPPRVTFQQLEAAVPAPSGLLSSLTCTVGGALGGVGRLVLGFCFAALGRHRRCAQCTAAVAAFPD